MRSYSFRDATIGPGWRRRDHEDLLALALQEFREDIQYLAIDPEAAHPSLDDQVAGPSLMSYASDKRG